MNSDLPNHDPQLPPGTSQSDCDGKPPIRDFDMWRNFTQDQRDKIQDSFWRDMAEELTDIQFHELPQNARTFTEYVLWKERAITHLWLAYRTAEARKVVKMRERKYTRGPWTILNYCSADKWITIKEPGVKIDYDDVDQQEQEANARLIAAAPDLLAACDRVVDAGQCYCHLLSAGIKKSCGHCQASAAIAKATGAK